MDTNIPSTIVHHTSQPSSTAGNGQPPRGILHRRLSEVPKQDLPKRSQTAVPAAGGRIVSRASGSFVQTGMGSDRGVGRYRETKNGYEGGHGNDAGGKTVLALCHQL